MPALSVADRITKIQNIFSSFGITVIPNSNLDLIVKSEFGPGKRSALNAILENLDQGTDAAILSKCIGQALEKNMHDPEIRNIAILLQERLPSLFKIIDIRQNTNKRIELLEKFLAHFEQKINSSQAAGNDTEQLDRLKRMLAGTRNNLRMQIMYEAAGTVVQELGVIFDLDDVKRCGKIFKIIVPSILVLDQANISAEQKINHCITALATLGHELGNTKLIKIATVLENIHWLARISLPKIPEQATIEQALKNLNIPLGRMTTQQIRSKALASGLTEKEIIQILYHSKIDPKIDQQQQKIIDATHKNQQYAAACGYIAQLGQELQCKELANIGIAGICMASMHQTYCELRTNNLNVVNFSESLGLILSTAGVLTKNPNLVKIGQCILEGVSAYAGIMAIPGAQAIAIPLAVCATLAKIILSSKNNSQQPTISAESQLQQILQQIVMIHADIRKHFAKVFQQLEAQHQQLLAVLDEGFACILACTQHSHIMTVIGMQNLERKMENLHYTLGKEFTELYLEHILNPIDEIEYYIKYEPAESKFMEQNKQKLCIWLLYKSKQCKANGRDLLKDADDLNSKSTYLNTILGKTIEHDSILGLINHYLNIEFAQTLPEDLPHVPSWILAAHTYIKLLTHNTFQVENPDRESNIVCDIIASGERILTYLQTMADNQPLVAELEYRINLAHLKIAEEIYNTINTCNPKCLDSLICANQVATDKFSSRAIYAQAAPPNQQLEKFDPIQLDISHVWHNFLVRHIPNDLFLAYEYGMGELQINYVIDPKYNAFVDLRLAHNHGLLPDEARDVVFRIDVSYKLAGQVDPYLLVSGLFAYDLGTAHRRFEEYYRAKFAYPLRHNRYLWISVDGMRNQVAGHGDTETHKLINHSGVAQLYARWWQNAQPVCQTEISARLKANPGFVSKYNEMLNVERCVEVYSSTIDAIQCKLTIQLQQQILQQRCAIGTTLIETTALTQLINKVDTYHHINYILRTLVNWGPKKFQIQQQLTNLLVEWQRPGNWQLDCYSDLKQLLEPNKTESCAPNLSQSAVYAKVKECIIRLKLLNISINSRNTDSSPRY